MKVVGITSCPSGVAHTYMAAEALKLSGQKLGIDVIIETQGGAGVENQLKQKDIDEAACVILVNDVALEGWTVSKGKKGAEDGCLRFNQEIRCCHEKDSGHIPVRSVQGRSYRI